MKRKNTVTTSLTLRESTKGNDGKTKGTGNKEKIRTTKNWSTSSALIPVEFNKANAVQVQHYLYYRKERSNKSSKRPTTKERERETGK